MKKEKKKKKIKETRIPFDDRHYIIEAICKSSKYRKRLKEINKKLEEKEKGLSIPPKGFGVKSVEGYHKWTGKIHKHGITTSMLLKEILRAFDVDEGSKELQLGLMWKVYLGKKKAPMNKLYHIRPEYDSNRKMVKLWVEIKPWTNKEDLNWNNISQFQKQLPNYIGKNKPWDNFERDVELYKLYLKVKRDTQNNKQRKKYTAHSRKASKFVYELMMEYEGFEKIQKDFNEKITFDVLSKAMVKCKKRLHNINLI